MTSSSARRRALKLTAIGLALASAGLAGCSCSVEAGTTTSETPSELDTAAVETFISMTLTEQSGVQPSSVECPDGMSAEEGNEYECTVVHPQDGPQQAVVTTQADGTFRFDVP